MRCFKKPGSFPGKTQQKEYVQFQIHKLGYEASTVVLKLKNLEYMSRGNLSRERTKEFKCSLVISVYLLIN